MTVLPPRIRVARGGGTLKRRFAERSIWCGGKMIGARAMDHAMGLVAHGSVLRLEWEMMNGPNSHL
ncbi:MAG TPA: hypothetical protein PLS39_12270 [Accumulibacter sp.]|nr:hypothetical protein [Accumulibacter sp.]HMW18512.1 hypothetical protein [Accumulibacter sp.]HMX23700.1 hypothetical protein [Accumulibacter sp.]HND81176.1 hypothetical protein [Accumulibacter sp.]HNE13891.1 hypothetical protein [Accumulibacter sp.]